jgi:hypothetical protein
MYVCARSFCASILLAVLVIPSAFAQSARTIEEYNNSLIANGISWKEGGVVYYPSFYTGFAPRVEDPNRIHIHFSRGNQMRMTIPLDEMTVLTYMYGLKKRSDIYTSMITSKTIVPVQHKLIDSFRGIVGSDAYKLQSAPAAFERGQMTREDFYQASLAALKSLNPGRIFDLRFNMRARALAWRDQEVRGVATRAQAAGAADANSTKAYLAKNTRDAIVVANNLLFGRINSTYLTDAQFTALSDIVNSVAAPVSDDAFVAKAIEFFKSVTLGRYDFRTVINGRLRPALECQGSTCELAYSEFTAIYPNGSVRANVQDRDGNTIPMIRENGVMHFVERGYADVDHIRVEPFYGFIPKMDYTPTGNGIHNPAVRTYLPGSKYKSLYTTLGIPKTDSTLWIVSRGQVSHGCTRVAAGHALEIHDVMPSNPREMPKVLYTGNNSPDYDLFDIDGSGQLKVMGVDYLIAYAIISDSGEGYREGNGLINEAFKKDDFYRHLYGSNQFVGAGGQYTFTNPSISYFYGVPSAQRATAFSVKFPGNYPLYEQAYEKDKLQFYDVPTIGVASLSGDQSDRTNEGHQLVRLMGRVAGCGPFAKEFSRCHETGFETEMSSVLARVR